MTSTCLMYYKLTSLLSCQPLKYITRSVIMKRIRRSESSFFNMSTNEAEDEEEERNEEDEEHKNPLLPQKAEEVTLKETPTSRLSASFSLEWNDLSYSVTRRYVTYETPLRLSLASDVKVILEKQSGKVASGTLTALMGPSGAGKTTLLNCITSRIKSGWSGSINYKYKKDADLASAEDDDCNLKMSFVPQKDHLFDTLTVRETIYFAIRFKNINSKLSEEERQTKVMKVASDLNLTSCLNVKVSNLSGGQCKRLSVAVELVSTPNILILDEPTSGLDSTNALIIMKVIKRLLQGGGATSYKPAIICSIHQPSFDCLKLFDSIYLLNENGKNIFFDSPKNILPFLSLNGIQLPVHCNPADYLLDVCYNKMVPSSCDNMSLDTKCQKSDNQLEVIIDANCNGDAYVIKSVLEATEETQNNLKSINYFSFFTLLLQRNARVLLSSPTPLIIRIIFCFINLFIPLMYNHQLGSHDGCWNSIMETVPGNKSILNLINSNKNNDGAAYVKNMELVTDNITFILMMTNFALYFHALITVAMVPIEVKIIQKEIYNNWYTINSYIAARIIFFVPIMMIQVVIFVTISFLVSSQLMEINRLSLAIGSFLLQCWIAEMVGIICGSLLPGNVVASTILTILYSFPVIVFGGYFVRVSSAHPFVSWFMWISQLRHTFEAVIIAVYGLGRCTHDGDSIALTAEDIRSPSKMMERFLIDYDVTHTDGAYIGPILGLQHDYCIGEVINGTRDYLGINYINNDENNYDDYYDDVDGTSDASFSYPMTSFGLHDSDLYRCFYCLSLLTLTYIVLAVLCVRRLIKN